MNGEALDAEAGTIDGSDPHRGRLHAVLLRPAPLPLGHLRRPGAVQAGELPLHGRLPRGDHALQKQADVADRWRLGGQGQGHQLAPDSECQKDPSTCNTTRATIEIDPQYAPISSDAQAILRQKTLLGETYVEITSGTRAQPRPTTGDVQAQSGTIDVGQLSGGETRRSRSRKAAIWPRLRSQDQTQIDEIFQGFDEQTRQSFQSWMQNAGIAVDGRGLDLNDAFGNVGPFTDDASDVLGNPAPSRSSRCARSSTTRATCSRRSPPTTRRWPGRSSAPTAPSARSPRSDEALADTFQILPTFENEGRLTLDRLKGFAAGRRPAVPAT